MTHEPTQILEQPTQRQRLHRSELAETLLAKLEQIEAKANGTGSKPRPGKAELQSRGRGSADSTPAPVGHLAGGGR